jgi:tetratricopeptide (TPR) repeat protein
MARTNGQAAPGGEWPTPAEAAAYRFESAFAQGGWPAIDDYLPAGGPQRQAVLIDLAHIDLERRLKAGREARVEDYLHYPELAGAATAVLDLLAAEYELRRRREPDLSAAEYVARFPQLADRLRPLLEATLPAECAVGPNPPGSAAAGALPAVPGYEVLGPLGQGGMGEVLRGHDLHLGRDLAVKVLREEHKGEPRLVQRFLAEARIHGRLQHPGIAPVHELGELPDRRPYFTMKLVEGRTLAALLDERADPSRDRPRFLTIFEQVCQAMGYAHSRGVIHRDLKPHNVMVGSFGEVQLMDWGLAKALAREEEGGRRKEEPDGSASSLILHPSSFAETQPGAVLGTPAYMAPEQARGEVESLDERSDVFGLGAILCVILTGEPPYCGSGTDEVLVQAKRAELDGAFARLHACGADAELVALCRDCLAPRREDRPCDGGAVAARVAAYQAAVQERLRRAELDRTAAQARAEEAKATVAAERKARRRALALATAVLALVAVGAVGGLVVQRQAAERARRDAELRQAVESALDRAAGLRQQARWREAQAVLDQARRGLGDAGPDDLRQRLKVAEAGLALVNRLDAIRQRRAAWVEGHFDHWTAVRDYAAAFREAGLGEVGDDEEAVAARVRASGVAGPLVAALDDWAAAANERGSRPWLLGVARRAAPDAWGDRFRDPAVWRDHRALQALAYEALRDNGAKLGEVSPQALAALGLLLGGGADAVPLLRAAQRRYPDDFWLSLHLSNALGHAKRMEEALGLCQVAVALRPDAAAAHNNLGIALARQKDLDGAAAEFKKAIELDPRLANAHSNLGNVLRDQKDLDGAVAACRQAIDCDPRYAPAHNNLGNALCDKGDSDGGIAAYRTAIDYDPRFALAYRNLGTALRKRKNLGAAIAAYHRAIEFDPGDAKAHNGLGNALSDKGDLDGAIAAYRKAIELDPQLAIAHSNLGIALHDKGDLAGAVAAYQKAIALDPDYAEAHTNLGIALRDKGNLGGAIAAFQKAIALDPKLARAHNNLGTVLHDQKDLAGAIAAYHKAIALDPEEATAHYNVGVALRDKKDRDGAIAAYRRAVALEPTYALAYYTLGNALRAREDLDGAIAAFQKATGVKPDYAEAHCNLGEALRAQGRFAEALEAYRRGHALGSKRPGWRDEYKSEEWVGQCERLVELDRKLPAVLAGQAEPAGAAEQLALAQLCQEYKRLYAAAARFYAGAFAADPRLAADLCEQPRYGAACSAALAAAGQGEDARHLPDKVQRALRRQALRWLRDDLALYAKLAGRDDPKMKGAVRRRLAHWRQDANLASVRDPQALDQLPEDERQQWRRLWDDVAALLAKAGSPN